MSLKIYVYILIIILLSLRSTIFIMLSNNSNNVLLLLSIAYICTSTGPEAVPLNYTFSSKTYSNSYSTAAVYADNFALSCPYKCSAKLKINVKSFANWNLFIDTYTSTLPLKTKSFVQANAGEEYSITLSANTTEKVYLRVFMIPLTSDYVTKTAEYTISLETWGFVLENPFTNYALSFSNGTETQCGGSSTSSEMSAISVAQTVIISLIVLWIIWASILIVILFVLVYRTHIKINETKSNDDESKESRDWEISAEEQMPEGPVKNKKEKLQNSPDEKSQKINNLNASLAFKTH